MNILDEEIASEAKSITNPVFIVFSYNSLM